MIAILCVLLINPSTAALFVFAFDLGIWGIWLSSVITQIAWCLAGRMACKKCLKNINEE